MSRRRLLSVLVIFLLAMLTVGRSIHPVLVQAVNEENNGDEKELKIRSEGGTIRQSVSGLMEPFEDTAEDVEIRFEARVEREGSNVKGRARLEIKATVNEEKVEFRAEWKITEDLSTPDKPYWFKGEGEAEIKVGGEKSKQPLDDIRFQIFEDDLKVDIADGADADHLIVSGSEIEKVEIEEKIESHETEEDVEVRSGETSVKFSKDKPKISYRYRPPGSIERSFKTEFKKFVEFVDQDGDGQIDNNETLFTLTLEELNWNITISNETDPQTDNTWYNIIYTHASENYDIAFVMYIYQFSTDGVDGGADEVKVDVIVNRWSWHNNTSYLALLSKTKAEIEAKGDAVELTLPQSDETGIYVEVSGVYVKFEWLTDISVDGDPDSIVNSYFEKSKIELETKQDGGEAEVELKVYIVYPHFSTLKHDPSVGVEDDPVDLQLIGRAISELPTPTPTPSPTPTKPTETPMPVEVPWYMNAVILAAIGILATLIGGIVSLFVRNRRGAASATE